MLIGTYYVHQVARYENVPDVPDDIFVHLRMVIDNDDMPRLSPLRWNHPNVPKPGDQVRLVAMIVEPS